MARRRDELAAEGVHLRQRADHSGIAEVICELASGEAWAGSRLNCDDPVVGLAPELFSHERSDEASEIRTASGTAYDDVRLDAVLVKGGLGFKAYDALMQEHLVQHRSEFVPVALLGYCRLDRFGNRATEAAAGTRELSEYLAAHIRGVTWGRSDLCTVSPHHFAAERLLLIGALYHIHLTVKSEELASHAQGRAPLAGTGLGRHALESLLLRVICLCDGGVELMAAGGVVAFELVVDFRRGAESLLKEICPHQWRRTVHLVEGEHLVRDVYPLGVIVQFLLYQLLAEDRFEVFCLERLACARVEKRGGLVFHVRADVVPLGRNFILLKVDFVRNLFVHLSVHFSSVILVISVIVSK